MIMLLKLKHTSNLSFIKLNWIEFSRLTYPNVQSDKLQIDYHQKLVLKFQIKDKRNDEFIRVQQAFLRFTNKKSKKEIIYLAEATNGVNSQYKVEVVRLKTLFFFNIKKRN